MKWRNEQTVDTKWEGSRQLPQTYFDFFPFFLNRDVWACVYVGEAKHAVAHMQKSEPNSKRWFSSSSLFGRQDLLFGVAHGHPTWLLNF